ncbi:MMPL family transporter [Shewanella sp. 202IG2-18]|uniref:efflux RND transporter permease subunit n=1 Tax=Parashewanella hymeniacidonis TaxID=2807618 RepID=UPI00195FB4B9|nr:efflux RND transporter permease subunit [Parashewanella hymeniacidonis]MBM7072183.1 MMPL family transporter [Parashewanella hymeniacidonis]
MIESLSRFALNRPKTVYSLLFLIVFVCLAMFPKITIDTDPENMLPASDMDRAFHNQVKSDFSMHDMLVIGAINNSEQGIYNSQSLSDLEQLSKKVMSLEHVIPQELLSLNTVDNITQAKHGGISFQWLMKNAPATEKQSIKIKTAVLRLPLLANTLVSDDGKAAAIYVAIDSKQHSYQVAENIRKLINDIQSKDDYHITGLPVAEDQFGSEMFVQMGIAAPMAGLAIFILLLWFFRSIKLVVGSMIVAMATVIITMGLLIGMGFTVHIMSSMIAIFLMPIAVVDSTHILSEFADEYRDGKDPKAVIQHVVSKLFKPMLYTSLTSAVGFLSLMLTPIPPVKVFGGFIAFGILLAFIITIVFIPAYISRMSPTALGKLQNSMKKQESAKLHTLLPKLGLFAIRNRIYILFGFSALFLISVVGISKIQVNDNPINWFKTSHEIRVADKALNQHFGGTYDAWLVLESDKKNHTATEKLLTSLEQSKLINASDLETINNSINQVSQTITILDDKLFNANVQQASIIESYVTKLETLGQDNKTFLKPDILLWMQELQFELVKSGLVGKVNSLPDIIKTVNRELNGGTNVAFKLPNSSDAVAQTLLQYQSSHRPQDLWHFVTPDYHSSLMWLQLTSGDNQHMSRVMDFVEHYVELHPLPDDLKFGWAGKTYLNVVWQKAMVNGMLESLVSAFVIVFLIMVILFRSVKYGLLAMLPLTLTITCIYGLIGWVGKDYDMPIAVLSALTLGLSVDFAIHFLERFRENLKQHGNVTTTLKVMFQEPARAISRNAIVIAVGFMPLLAAPLIPYITVGFFLASIMALSGIVTLLLLPSILSFKRNEA